MKTDMGDALSLRESEIRPQQIMQDKQAMLQHDRDFLLARRDRFVRVDCPACGGGDAGAWDEKHGFAFVRCDACGTIFMNPRPDQDTLHDFYRQSLNYAAWNQTVFPATEAVRMQKIIKPRAHRLIEACRRHGLTGGTVLEVGAAFGTFGIALQELGFFSRYLAVEPTPDLAHTCRARGLETFEFSIEALDLGAAAVDVVVAFEVIEHLFDPMRFIAASVRHLRPGGLLVLSCPNSDALGPLLVGARDQNFNHEHLNYFRPDALSGLVARHGLQTLEVTTPGLLDVELLKNAMSGRPPGAPQPSGLAFWERFFAVATQAHLDDMQRLIAGAGLSSHMWLVAQKTSAKAVSSC